MPRHRPLHIAVLAAAVLAPGAAAQAADIISLTLSNNRFIPDQVTVPAGQRFRIELHNQDATPAELESPELRIEKVVVPGGKITVSAGPLKPGAYKFVDEYHPETAVGTLTVTETTARN